MTRYARGLSAGWPRRIAGTGVVFALVLLGEIILAALESGPATDTFTLGVLTSIPFILGMVYGGYWLAGSELPTDRYDRVGRWWVAGGVLGVLIIFPINATIQPISAKMVVGTFRWSASLGGGVGLALGILQARAIQRAAEIERINERARVQFADGRNEQGLLTYLGDLFSEDIRPLVTEIEATASSIDTAASERVRVPETESLDRQTRRLDTLTRHVETLLSTRGADSSLAPINLVGALRRAAEEISRFRPDATIEIETPGENAGEGQLFVRANQSLTALFVELFDYICQGSATSTPELSVRIAQDTERATVRITDADSGVPDDASVFDYHSSAGSSADTGPGLVGMLLSYYGGSIEILEEEGDALLVVGLQRVPIEDTTAADIEGERQRTDSAR